MAIRYSGEIGVVNSIGQGLSLSPYRPQPAIANGGEFILTPAAATSAGVTHATLLTTNLSFSGSFQFSGQATTLSQTRINTTPNPWEVAWVLWHYSDNTHFYYFIVKPNGWELGKEDPAYPGNQRIIDTGRLPDCIIGQNYSFQLAINGASVSISVNGAFVVAFTDAEAPIYTSGKLGLYTEDSQVKFWKVSSPSGLDPSLEGIGTVTADGTPLRNWTMVFAGGGSLVSRPPSVPTVGAVSRYGVSFDGATEQMTKDWPASGGPTLATKATVAMWLQPAANSNDIFYGANFAGTGFFCINNSGQLLFEDGALTHLLAKNAALVNGTKYFLMVSIDTTQALAANRLRVWLGVYNQAGSAAEITSWDTDNRASIVQNSAVPLTQNSLQLAVAAQAILGRFSGTIADFYLVDGTAVTDPGVFAQDIGGLRPVALAAVTYGVRSVHLDMSLGDFLGNDTSGNANDMALTDITAADQVIPYL